MALLINDQCINCDVCEPECPNEAIYQGELIYEIDTEKCTECVGHYTKEQCIVVCPVDCILVDPDNTESQAELQVKFTTLTGQVFDKDKEKESPN